MHRPDLPAPHWSHSACPLRAWHWYDREHGCAGCCILMYDSAEREHALLRDTSFRYIPAALPGEEGYYTGLYSDHSAEDPLLQMTARFARDRDRDAPALRFELHSTRARLYRALTLLAPFVSVGSVEHDAIYPVRTQMPTRVAWPEVGGIIPPRGP